jgi:hypothetical protein
MGEFLKSIRMDASDECFITDSNQRFCDDDQYRLSFYVNGDETQDIMSYVPNDDDRILITYGEENTTEVNRQLQELNSLPINKI